MDSARRTLTPRVSVVIPVLDEASRIGGLVDELAAITGLHEVVVVDGGSGDGTQEIVAARPGVRLLAAPRGRGPQMNAGAAGATGDVYLFLHADVRLPPAALEHVHEALADPATVGGAFRTWTVAETGRSWFAPLLHLADLRSRLTSLPYGDQAVFVRSEAFWRVGGFPEIPIFEDLELSRRLRRIGRLRRLSASVTVSGRRFLARPVYFAALMTLLPWLFRLGVAPSRLERLYGHVR